MQAVERYNNTLCVRAAWLFEIARIMSRSTYKSLVSRKQLNVVRKGGNGRYALVSYESIPTRIKEIITAKHGDIREMLPLNLLQEKIEYNEQASSFFQRYKLSDGRNLSESIQHEYYTNAILLEACGRFIGDRLSHIKTKLNSPNSTQMWEALSSYIAELSSVDYPHSLPTHPRRLAARYKAYRTEGLISLIHKNFCNTSAAKVDDAQKEALLIEVIGKNSNLDNVQIRDLYNIAATTLGWKPITASAVDTWRKRHKMITEPSRRGETNFMNTRTMQIKRSRPTAPLNYWTLDGWQVELMYQEFKKGRTIYYQRPTVVVVLDPFNNYPIGYAVGDQETPTLIKAALRNALDHTVELFGARYKTHQLQSDNYGRGALTPIYQAICKHYTPAKVHNAKAKVIEPYFNQINKKYCQLMPNWSGFGVTSKKDNQPNSDYLNKSRKQFPEFEGAIAQVDRMIALERASKIEAYRAAWDALTIDDRLPMDDETYLYWFGETTGERNLLTGSGVTATINGIKHTFDCFDIKFREHYSTRWTLKFDPNDLSRVLAVNDDSTLRYLLQRKHIQPMALKDRQLGDAAKLEEVRDYNKKLTQHITDKRAESHALVTELFEQHPELNDTLLKHMLVDSNGQHKDRRNDNRSPAREQAPLLENKSKRKKAPLIIRIDNDTEDFNINKML